MALSTRLAVWRLRATLRGLEGVADRTDPPAWETVYRCSNDLVLRNISGENLLVPITGDLAKMQAVWVLNPVSAFIWGRIDGMRSLAKIRELVLTEFEVGADEAEADLLAFVGELEDAGLVAP
jgi:hypothetical protein